MGGQKITKVERKSLRIGHHESASFHRFETFTQTPRAAIQEMLAATVTRAWTATGRRLVPPKEVPDSPQPARDIKRWHTGPRPGIRAWWPVGGSGKELGNVEATRLKAIQFFRWMSSIGLRFGSAVSIMLAVRKPCLPPDLSASSLARSPKMADCGGDFMSSGVLPGSAEADSPISSTRP